ncbi:hypothetical protein ABZY31_02405 [Streptomyces sp. NPDC006529]|uniref:hypothetical protein n=1 Tax=Streptomyces sp. NPDC006529 TaxID=3157177 RepID=UPI0033A31038
MPDRRQPSSPTPPSAPDRDPRQDNPYAAPPEGRPDQLWEPRSGADGHERRNRDRDGGDGPGGPAGGPARWDPTDPVQRRARYALLAGMWGFFLGVFGIPSAGLLLGALALYWGVSALRGKRPAPREEPSAPGAAPAPATPAPAESGLAALGPAARPQRAAAVSGLVTASLALILALGTYGLQIAYKDFYICRDDALTRTAELQCNTQLPDNFLGDVLKVPE